MKINFLQNTFIYKAYFYYIKKIFSLVKTMFK